ncbi:S9 family peptidase [Altericroceibacterium endophyticum]|uniref:Prolyl oligopeptidase family serine peptidase n=1 Tax=Altericroceibacterium endophyticum TaxID=1808508 RepID=A0A6I4T7S3_9SPHN|nr:S9 family peptidase [Altericroceibacterium endophyticum]MXO65845.1 prolyl oligopeptidase family serine peptidase [Altericroceibacterium endophyticum]
MLPMANSTTGTEPTRPEPIHPPLAAKKNFVMTHHGIAIDDPYAWLRDPGYPEVSSETILAHLEEENRWFETRMKPQGGMVKKLFAEMRGRIKEADRSVPQKDGDYLYWVEYEEGAEYKKWWRRPVGAAEDGSADQLILDEVALAEGKDYFRLGAFSISSNGRLLAYAVDDNGSERFTARIKDLYTGAMLGDEIPGTLSSLIWVGGDKGLVYSLANEQWRTDNARLHWLGDAIEKDIELYHEDDEGFRVSSALSANEEWLIIGTGDHETSEIRLLPAADPLVEPILVRAREVGVEYDVDLRDDTLFIHANDRHENFRLATAPLTRPGEWTTLIEGSDEFYLTGFELFKRFYVTEGRLNGLDTIQIRSYDDAAQVEEVAFPEESYSAGLADNPEWDMEKLRLSYESMVSPATTYDYHVAEKRLEVLKVQEIPSGYDRDLYVTERLDIEARDGTKVPVSLMYRKDRAQGGPLHLYGYGAYGLAIPPGFSTTRLSLVDRGFAYAIAHIRGGDDLGRAWYKAGKLESRTNAFTDFVDVAKGLIARGDTKKGRISISGGSAGGELMGAVINSDPDLFGACVAHVPFVDVLATMLDASLPLTPGEWPEWGNPIEDREAFELIRSYSPYDNVRAQAYPPLLVTAGLNDPRVTYWEPAKWAAKLRELKTDDNELLLKTNMGAGHGGKSGRFQSLEEMAEEFAFILWQFGLSEEETAAA